MQLRFLLEMLQLMEKYIYFLSVRKNCWLLFIYSHNQSNFCLHFIHLSGKKGSEAVDFLLS